VPTCVFRNSVLWAQKHQLDQPFSAEAGPWAGIFCPDRSGKRPQHVHPYPRLNFQRPSSHAATAQLCPRSLVARVKFEDELIGRCEKSVSGTS